MRINETKQSEVVRHIQDTFSNYETQSKQWRDRMTRIYKNWLIYHTLQWCEELEHELKRFPRGKHDDIVDSLQMLYNMYELVPNTWAKKRYYTI